MSPIAFYLDENIDRRVAMLLRNSGIDVLTVKYAGMRGKTDIEHLLYAKQLHRVLVTHDKDFIQLVGRMTNHAGVIRVNATRFTAQILADTLIQIHATTTREEMLGKLIAI